MKQLTEDEFDDQFTPVPGADGDVIRDTDAGLDRDSNKLWTIVDPGEGTLYAASGWHYVNRIGYVITEESWTEPTEGVWHSLADDDESDDAEPTKASDPRYVPGVSQHDDDMSDAEWFETMGPRS